jgi:hypothetical protein
MVTVLFEQERYNAVSRLEPHYALSFPIALPKDNMVSLKYHAGSNSRKIVSRRKWRRTIVVERIRIEPIKSDFLRFSFQSV